MGIERTDMTNGPTGEAHPPTGGGATDRLFSTRLMWARVGFQAFTLLLLALAVFMR